MAIMIATDYFVLIKVSTHADTQTHTDTHNVIKEMIDMRDEFKECQGFSRRRWKDL